MLKTRYLKSTVTEASLQFACDSEKSLRYGKNIRPKGLQLTNSRYSSCTCHIIYYSTTVYDFRWATISLPELSLSQWPCTNRRRASPNNALKYTSDTSLEFLRAELDARIWALNTSLKRVMQHNADGSQKQKRATNACDGCRARKIKVSGTPFGTSRHLYW